MALHGVIWMWFACIAPLTHHQRLYWIIGPVKHCYPTFWSLITQHAFRDYPLWLFFPHADPNQSFSISPLQPTLQPQTLLPWQIWRGRGRRKRGRERGPKHLPFPLQTQQLPEWQRWRDHRVAAPTHTHSHALTFTERKTFEFKSVSSKNLDPDERISARRSMMGRTLAKIYPSFLLTCY